MRITRDINEGIARFRENPDAVLLDVRSEEAYREGHVPGSIRIALEDLEEDIEDYAPAEDTPIYVYCTSGNHSLQAAMMLQNLGYENAGSIGGYEDYSGPVETGRP